MIDSKPSFIRPPDGLSPDQRALLNTPFRIAPGYGMRVLGVEERARRLATLELEPAPKDVLLVYEPPRRGFLYVVSVDVSTGTGLDNSVIEVTRVATIREPDEQVAQFVTNRIDEMDLAYIIDPVGRLYKGKDDQFALVGIECNGMGLSTQNELLRHIGYNNLYIWQYLDAVEGHQFTTKYGWYTNQRSRPIMLQRYVHAIKTVDPRTGIPDYRVNSPHTFHEMADFQTPGPLWLAEATDGATDDCIMAGAIGVHIAQTLQYDQRETVHEARRRMSEEGARLKERAQITEQNISPQTTDISYDELMGRDEGYYDEADVHHFL